MFFSNAEWPQVKLDVISPLPIRSAMCGESEDPDFIVWKNLRSQISQENEGFLKRLCESWFLLVANPVKRFPILNAPFLSAWNVTLPENDDPRAVRVSCLKWETMCVLTRSILANLGAFLNKPDATGNQQDKLSIAIGCAQHAIEELRIWQERGNLSSWNRDSDFIPLEIDISFFETLHGTCRVLYELYSLSKMDSGEGVLATAGVLLSLIKRIERIASDSNVPVALDYFMKTLVNAIDVGISQRMVETAFDCKILPLDKTSWSEIGYWQQRVIRAKHDSRTGFRAFHNSMGFGKSEEMKDAEATLSTISRLDESSYSTYSEPRLESLDFDLHFSFPYTVT
jgi:hypothetical protein